MPHLLVVTVCTGPDHAILIFRPVGNSGTALCTPIGLPIQQHRKPPSPFGIHLRTPDIKTRTKARHINNQNISLGCMNSTFDIDKVGVLKSTNGAFMGTLSVHCL